MGPQSIPLEVRRGAETTLQWHYPVILPQQLRAILRNRPTANNSMTKLYICSLLLLNACDTETNPGPGADHSTVYPCGACDMPVTWAQQAVACETCSVWYNIDCQGISSQTYDALHSSAVVWNCHSGGVTDYTATLFDLTSLVTSNSFSSLQEDSSIHSIDGSPGPPLAASSPTPKQRLKPNKVKRPLRLANVNFHSIRNKQAEVLNLIHSTQADVLVGTETWLTTDHLSSEYFPTDQYGVFRKDRPDGYGGVLIAVSREFLF